MITGHSALIEGDWFSFLSQFRGPEPYKDFPILLWLHALPRTDFFISQSCVSDGKESVCSAEGPSSIPGSKRSPGEGNGYSLQYSWLENSMDREAMGSKRVGHDRKTNSFTKWNNFGDDKFKVLVSNSV